MLYLDSSALVKKYIREKGSDAILHKIQEQSGADAIPFTSILTYAEILSAFARRATEGTLSAREVAHVRREFENDWAVALAPIALDSGVLLFARDLLSRLYLKGSDALHLGSALWLRDAARSGMSARLSTLTFATSDDRLAKAASSQNLAIFNPETPQVP